MSTYQVHDPHWIVAMDRMDDLLREARRCRLARQARPARSTDPGLWDRALAGIGSLLISAGERLQAHCTTTVYHTTEAYCVEP